MDNEELDNLFSSDNEEILDTSAEENADVVGEPSVEIEEVVEELEENSSDDEEKAKAEQKKIKQQKKIEARKEAIREIEEFEAAIERKRQAQKKLREEKKREKMENYEPLLSRQYLEDFPLDFKTVVVSLLGLLVLTICLCVAFMPSLRISNYVVEGNYQLTDDEIIELVGINEGEHMIRSYYGVENRIVKTTPYIKEIKISPVYPSTLKVEVVERQKIAYIQTADGYAVIDKDGIVLEFSSDYEADVHPVLCGLEVNSVVIGQNIGITDNLSYQKMIVILGAVLSAEQNSIYDSDYSFFESLKEVRILPSGTIFITVALPNNELLTVKLNDITTIDDKMHWLMYAIEEGGMDSLPAGSLDMTEDSPIFHQYETYG